jgi:hypothetical protein
MLEPTRTQMKMGFFMITSMLGLEGLSADSRFCLALQEIFAKQQIVHGGDHNC